MTGTPGNLPFVDEHAAVLDFPPDEAFAKLDHYARRVWVRPRRRLVEHLLGTRFPGGFEVAEASPPTLLVMAGSHRFSDYRLEFRLAEVPGATRVAARTYARFPGPHGYAYRTLVIRTRLHALATRSMLAAIANERL